MIIPRTIKIITTVKKGHGIAANRDFKKGEYIFDFKGTLLSGYLASCDALQIAENIFLESSMGFDNNLNHSCDPNCFIDFAERERANTYSQTKY